MSTPDIPTGFTELEYIESSGTQVMKTGLLAYKANVRADFMPMKSHWLGKVCGCYRHGSSNYSSMGIQYWGRDDGTVYVSSGTTGLSITDNTSILPGTTRVLAEINPTEGVAWVEINGVRNTKTGKSQYIECAATIALFAEVYVTNNTDEWGWDIRNKGSLRLYSFKGWYEPGVLVRDLIPALDIAGVPCMFDKVSGQPYYNVGSGTFGYKIKATGETVAPVRG